LYWTSISLKARPTSASTFGSRIDQCTHLIAVLSEATVRSWWVPFEIGIATQDGDAISSVAPIGLDLPDYLKKWPFLQTREDVVEYARAATRAEGFLTKSLFESPRGERRDYANRFHADLKRRLGQA